MHHCALPCPRALRRRLNPATCSTAPCPAPSLAALPPLLALVASDTRVVERNSSVGCCCCCCCCCSACNAVAVGCCCCCLACIAVARRDARPCRTSFRCSGDRPSVPAFTSPFSAPRCCCGPSGASSLLLPCLCAITNPAPQPNITAKAAESVGIDASSLTHMQYNTRLLSGVRGHATCETRHSLHRGQSCALGEIIKRVGRRCRCSDEEDHAAANDG
jgi:hypothetical protein